jgi:hypothetical protein
MQRYRNKKQNNKCIEIKKYYVRAEIAIIRSYLDNIMLIIS